ncbi:GTP cyclohydrolase I FolE [Aquabacter sp. CN5-332]|uniref:GTP cyclohydrolase I FolE n=1 Tax=Aquabacter sp. CN5-332 TaxID=3156608 RepID=UPI0032B34D3E
MTRSEAIAIDRDRDVKKKIMDAVTQTLIALGEDPDREGLRETPRRVAKMYLEIFSGLNEDPRKHLTTQFCADGHEDIVIVKDISFFSMCEHHLLPFFGKAHVAYLPQDGRLAGLSKIARVVHTLARRPQLQERLSTQIVEAMWDALRPKGVFVLIEAEHLCMAMRGVRAPNSATLTVVSKGVLETDAAMRAEAFKLLRG